jgi:hypothetical protein
MGDPAVVADMRLQADRALLCAAPLALTLVACGFLAREIRRLRTAEDPSTS